MESIASMTEPSSPLDRTPSIRLKFPAEMDLVSFSICRIYSRDHAHDREIQKALFSVLGDAGDAKTNM
jgi:hypothetical protein